MKESRKEGRVSVTLVTRYREPTMLEPREGECRDLSYSGMCILTARPSPRGALVRFECVTGTPDEWIRGTGRVVWQRGKNDPRGEAGMGVRFVRLEPGSRESLERLIGAPRASVGPVPAQSEGAPRSPAVQTLIIAPGSGSGVTQTGLGAMRPRAVHYPTLRGVGHSRPPAQSRGSSEGRHRSSNHPPPGANATHLELPKAGTLPSPFPPSPSSPPPPEDAEFVESPPEPERLGRTQRGMPGPSSSSPGIEGAANGSGRTPTSDRPRGSRSDRPPQPGGVDDLRGSNLPRPGEGSPSSNPPGLVPTTANGQRIGATNDVARARAVASSDPPPRQSDPDVARAKNWLPWIIIGMGLLASAFMVTAFGSLPAFLRSDKAEAPAEVPPKEATPPAEARPPAPSQPPAQPPAAPAAGPTPGAGRYVLDVQSDPPGARVSAAGKSVIAPGALELGALTDKVEVTAELDGYEPQLVQLEPSGFQAKADGQLVRSLAFKLVARPQAARAKPAAEAPPAAPAAPRAAKAQAPKSTPKASAPAAQAPATPQIAEPPVPIDPPAPPAGEPAAGPVLNIVPSNGPAPAADQPTPLERATDCLARGDNTCVIAALEGQAKSERELVILIETHLAMGHRADAERGMRRYVEAYPNGPSAAKYRRNLERRTDATAPAAPPAAPPAN